MLPLRDKAIKDKSEKFMKKEFASDLIFPDLYEAVLVRADKVVPAIYRRVSFFFRKRLKRKTIKIF